MRLVLWVDGAHDAPSNMARDAKSLERVAAEASAPAVLRLFRFAPAGITLGRAQDPARELDLERLAADGVSWAVRPTGGRAIWHDEEWTFSLVTRLGPGGWAADPHAAYERTGRLLAASLTALGVPATLAPGSPRGPGAPRERAGAAPACFASSARHELLLEGRKLAGIAQRALHGALLQQGSVLLGDSHLRLADYQRGPAEEIGARREVLAGACAHAGDVLGRDAALERWAEALRPWLGVHELHRGPEAPFGS